MNDNLDNYNRQLRQLFFLSSKAAGLEAGLKAGDRLFLWDFYNKNTASSMPIKIINNRGINIKRQLLSIKLSINVNSKKGFVFAQKNAARCISGQDKKK